MSLDIHSNIEQKLQFYLETNKIPNILFHGTSGSGKRTIVNKFINKIYDNDKEKIKKFTMKVNCSFGKGIKFIREELKFFAKTHINSNGGSVFKSIMLFNADKLTMDAQSALRRCIELFSHTTRFFIIAENKYNLMKPILSRFCEIHFPEPTNKWGVVNLHRYNLDETFKMTDIKTRRSNWLKQELLQFNKTVKTHKTATALSIKLYEKAYSGKDLINLLEQLKINEFNISECKKYEFLMCFNKVKSEFRNEKLLILFILNFIFLSSDASLENISFM